MIQDIAPHQLHKEFKIKKPEKSAFIIYVWDNKILLKGTKEEPRTFLTVADLEAEVSEIYNKAMYLFAIDEQEFFLLQEVELLETEERHFYNPNFFRTFQPKEHAFAAITGIQLDRWYKNRKFCGRCGARNEPRTKERSLICPKCKNTEYPKLCPAVIIAVVHGNRILLSKYAGREYKNYALVAGFVEYGETLEDTVRREVMEEVGLKVGRMVYYKSQPWALSDSLLAGFYVELEGSEEITLEEEELALAEWFEREEIPVSDSVANSLTNEMIMKFKNGWDPFGMNEE